MEQKIIEDEDQFRSDDAMLVVLFKEYGYIEVLVGEIVIDGDPIIPEGQGRVGASEQPEIVDDIDREPGKKEKENDCACESGKPWRTNDSLPLGLDFRCNQVQ